MSARLYVGGLPEDVKKSEIEDLFDKYGRIRDVDLKFPRTGVLAARVASSRVCIIPSWCLSVCPRPPQAAPPSPLWISTMSATRRMRCVAVMARASLVRSCVWSWPVAGAAQVVVVVALPPAAPVARLATPATVCWSPASPLAPRGRT